MRENKYDAPEFFEKYSRMPRSVDGLRAAGEWHALRSMLPELSGARVLDLGCGYGWHCRYAMECGAREVLGIDVSEMMLAEAGSRNNLPGISYRRLALEDLDLPAASFDVVLSSLALHYVESFSGVCGKVHDFLSPGGHFVFSVEHPVFTARGDQDWWHGPDGERLHWPVDRYFQEGEREAVFLGTPVRKYHRTLTAYIGGLLSRGFSICNVVEPEPDSAMLDVPGMRDELRRPMMLLVSARKI